MVGTTASRQFEQSFAALDRSRLVRLCARLTGSVDAAEDLAQETLLQAWRIRHRLHYPDGRDRWLAAIARNVCRRWLRGVGQRTPRATAAESHDEVPDGFDLEGDLERCELAGLLDRAMALLPAETRAVLVARYVDESTYAEIAGRLGISEDAVSMRLTRGKRQLRQVLATDLQPEARAYGVGGAGTASWRETSLWCPTCGRNRLLIRQAPPPGVVAFRCPVCQHDPEIPASEFRLANVAFARLIASLSQPRSIANRTAAWAHDYFRLALAEGSAPCTNCGQPARLAMIEPQHSGYPVSCAQHRPRPYVSCNACGEASSTSLRGLVLTLPETRRFWREHGRIRALPERELEVAGSRAVVTRFESLTRSAAINVISRLDRYEVIAIHQTPADA